MDIVRSFMLSCYVIYPFDVFIIASVFPQTNVADFFSSFAVVSDVSGISDN